MVVDAILENVDVDRTALEQRVYGALRQKIVNRELAPGTILTIRQVATALNVSPTPVRDALRRLQVDGLLRDRGRLGAEIVGLTARDVIELFDARTALETYAARAAALRRPVETLHEMRSILDQCPSNFDNNHAEDLKRFAMLDAQFHLVIIRASENDRIAQMYQAINLHIQLIRLLRPEVLQRAQANHHEHLAIARALEHGNPEEMAQAVSAHIANSRDCILRMMAPDHRI